MSWNKNTVNHSRVDSIITVLEQLNIPYSLTEIGKVAGHGINDDSGKTYSMRRLAYADFVVLEGIDRYDDCDADDVIISETFPKDQEPKDWKVEERIIEPTEDDFVGHYGIPEGYDPAQDDQADGFREQQSEDKYHRETEVVDELTEDDPEFYNG